MKITEKVNNYIRQNALFAHRDQDNNDRDGKECVFLVALSGGADSVALMLLMNELGYRIEAVHCNFHLRGEESDRDEAFCVSLCEKENVPLHRVHFDTLTYAELHKVSIEMAARELRYRYFEQLRVHVGAADTLVAHHQDDTVETLLINLVRGTGIHGLQGIKPRNGHIVRPLLCVSKEEILCYLDCKGQAYVTDSTNLVDDVVRNKIRLKVIPLLKEINSAASENIARTALRVVEAGKVFDDAMDRECSEICSRVGEFLFVSQEKLRHAKSVEYTLHTLLSPLGFNPLQVEEMSNDTSWNVGKHWESKTHVLAVDRDTLIIKEKKADGMKPVVFPETGNYVLAGDGRMVIKTLDVTDDFIIERSRDVATLDAVKVTFPLVLRKTKEGDRFVPFGMKGSKLVSDYMCDRKKNYFEKQDQMVLTDARGEILWVVGERPDGRYCVSENTIKAVTIRYTINQS